MVFVVCPHLLKAFILYVMWSALCNQSGFSRGKHMPWLVAKYLSIANLVSPVGLINPVNLIFLSVFWISGLTKIVQQKKTAHVSIKFSPYSGTPSSRFIPRTLCIRKKRKFKNTFTKPFCVLAYLFVGRNQMATQKLGSKIGPATSAAAS